MSVPDRLADAIRSSCPEAELWADRIASAVVSELAGLPGAIFGLQRDDGEALFDEYTMLGVAGIDDWDAAVDDARRDICSELVTYTISMFVPVDQATASFRPDGSMTAPVGPSIGKRRLELLVSLLAGARDAARGRVLAHSTESAAAVELEAIDADTVERCRILGVDPTQVFG